MSVRFKYRRKTVASILFENHEIPFIARRFDHRMQRNNITDRGGDGRRGNHLIRTAVVVGSTLVTVSIKKHVPTTPN